MDEENYEMELQEVLLENNDSVPMNVQQSVHIALHEREIERVQLMERETPMPLIEEETDENFEMEIQEMFLENNDSVPMNVQQSVRIALHEQEAMRVALHQREIEQIQLTEHETKLMNKLQTEQKRKNEAARSENALKSPKDLTDELKGRDDADVAVNADENAQATDKPKLDGNQNPRDSISFKPVSKLKKVEVKGTRTSELRALNHITKEPKKNAEKSQTKPQKKPLTARQQTEKPQAKEVEALEAAKKAASVENAELIRSKTFTFSPRSATLNGRQPLVKAAPFTDKKQNIVAVKGTRTLELRLKAQAAAKEAEKKNTSAARQHVEKNSSRATTYRAASTVYKGNDTAPFLTARSAIARAAETKILPKDTRPLNSERSQTYRAESTVPKFNNFVNKNSTIVQKKIQDSPGKAQTSRPNTSYRSQNGNFPNKVKSSRSILDESASHDMCAEQSEPKVNDIAKKTTTTVKTTNNNTSGLQTGKTQR